MESQRSKRDVDNNDATIGDYYDADENNIEPTKRTLGKVIFNPTYRVYYTISLKQRTYLNSSKPL